MTSKRWLENVLKMRHSYGFIFVDLREYLDYSKLDKIDSFGFRLTDLIADDYLEVYQKAIKVWWESPHLPRA